jgi:hypothetical protein
MAPIAATLLAALAASLPAERVFWVPQVGHTAAPTQVQVSTALVARGDRLAVYQDTRDEPLLPAELDELVQAFDSRVFPQQVAAFGPCPDRDGNGVVLLVVSNVMAERSWFVPFDALSDAAAAAYGLHSNEGEVIYASLRHRGNQAVWNQHAVAAAFHELLHHTHDPAETLWRHLLGNYAGVMAGLSPVRMLWGEADPQGRSFRPEAPWSANGWPLLFLHYLQEQLGSNFLSTLVAHPQQGFAALDALLVARGETRRSSDLLADFAMACWLADPALAGGRFGFRTVIPPCPHPITRFKSSRPISAQLPVGVGGMTFLALEGTSETPLPLALQGEAGVRWVGRAVLVRRLGPDTEVTLAFNGQGAARVESPALGPGDELRVAVVPVPPDPASVDERTVVLQLGLGWVPRPNPAETDRRLAELVAGALPAGGQAARTRLGTTIARLVGRPQTGSAPLATRYAWSPAREDVVAALLDEAARRGLPARVQAFSRKTPSGLVQEWQNVLIEVPGTDPRRWPVVLAAHWDAARPCWEESYLAALNLHDNASGVAVVLEAAAALARRPHRSPLVFALLAGGTDGGAGAAALVEALEGRIAAWVELDGVAVPSRGPGPLSLLAETSERPLQLAPLLGEAFRRVGLALRKPAEPFPPHSGAPLAAQRGIPFVVMRSEPCVIDTHTVPVVVEQQLASEEFMLLVAVATADVVSRLGGGAPQAVW